MKTLNESADEKKSYPIIFSMKLFKCTKRTKYIASTRVAPSGLHHFNITLPT